MYLTEKIQEDCAYDARLKSRIILFLNEMSKLDHLSEKFKDDFLMSVEQTIEKELGKFGESPIVEKLRKARKVVNVK